MRVSAFSKKDKKYIDKKRIYFYCDVKKGGQNMNKKQVKERVITVKLTEAAIDKLDTYAKKMKINRSQLVRNMVDNNLDDLDILKSSGFLAMALKGVDLMEVLKTSLRKKQYVVENNKLIIDL
jgi:mannitol-specific phosphotransferase system IIBC component